jgi:MoaA/NifB/PqqE/SkfB family radical SAM enzyme
MQLTHLTDNVTDIHARYPRLKHDLHLRREKSDHLLLRESRYPDAITHARVPHAKARVLGLLSGADSYDRIVALLRSVDGSTRNDTEEFCAAVLREYEDCIELLDHPSEAGRPLPLLEFVSSEPVRLQQPASCYDHRLSAPVRLSLMPTARCSCSCRYCCNAPILGDPEVVAVDVYVRFLQEARESGCLNLVFTGGEPTLYPELPQLIEVCTRLGLKAEVASRAQADLDLWDRLLCNGLKYVQISLDAMEEAVVDSLSGAGAYRRTMTALSFLLRNGVDLLVNAVMTGPSIEGAPRLVGELLDRGVPAVRLSPFMPPVGQWDIEAIQVTPNQKEKFNAFVSAASSQWGTRVSAFLYSHAISHRIVPRRPHGQERGDPPKLGCSSGTSEMLIGHDGRAVYCDRIMSLPGMTYGNIQDASLLELWHGAALRRLRLPAQSLHENSPCGDCPDYLPCIGKGKCYYYSYLNYSRPYAPDFLCSRVPRGEQVRGIV